MSFPALFVSHGAPTLIIENSPARAFLAGLGQKLGRPQAIVVISAHWEAPLPTVNAVSRNDTIHDFYGFPAPLYQLTYPAPGSAERAATLVRCLNQAGIQAATNERRGLDHGAWVPLKLMYPEADIPVLQLSLLQGQGAAAHYALGQALRPLRAQGFLIIGSGGFTHNLRELDWHHADAAEPVWVSRFCQWIAAALQERRIEDLLDYRKRAPEAGRNHPTEEHFMPFFVALGAGDPQGLPDCLHQSRCFGSLRLDAYGFS